MRTVLVNGCFDVLHWGHLLHLKMARDMGDHLIVALTANEFVDKGPGRPIFNEEKRAAMLLELRCVDAVIIYREPVPLDTIRRVRPAVYVKGKEYEGRLPEQALVEELGGRVEFTDAPTWSSTETVKRLREGVV